MVKGGPRAAKGFGGAADRLPIDLYAAEHFVFDLKCVAGIEEVVLSKEWSGDPIGMGMEGARQAQGGDFGVRRRWFGLFHEEVELSV